MYARRRELLLPPAVAGLWAGAGLALPAAALSACTLHQEGVFGSSGLPCSAGQSYEEPDLGPAQLLLHSLSGGLSQQGRVRAL
jgi:hypothetical protein